MKLQEVKSLCNSVCWNGNFSVEISPLDQIHNMNCPTIVLREAEDSAGEFYVDAGEQDIDGNYILSGFDQYEWPEWALTQELHITVNHDES